MRRYLFLLVLLPISFVAPVHGAVGMVQDHRIVIPVSKTERSLLLLEMREYLHGLHAIQYALANKDS
ncbi:MAG: hypothetical protein FJ209_12240, partial [Betaproteobacteria bacterium]|nr:hypothetical protein [Betaproteobacteria bacterium]